MIQLMMRVSKFLVKRLGPTAAFSILLVSGICADDLTGTQIEFFESKIRPVLVEHCYECHSAETDASGGLVLDSQPGWALGGESGDAIIPFDVDNGHLLRAIRYSDPDFQMPPDGKLEPSVIDDFEHWIAGGAVDPRQTELKSQKKNYSLSVEEAQSHWCYRPIDTEQLERRLAPLDVTDGSDAALQDSLREAQQTARQIDALVNREIEIAGLPRVESAPRHDLLRRLNFDLTGLPPRPNSNAHEADGNWDRIYAQRVNDLMDSPHFGEHFARHWMDVARFAESITLRGFVLEDAWRYRDYLIESFAADKPFSDMIREQLAGDLLPANALVEQQRSRLTALMFLTLGNTNLEKQDKQQLEMDYIDEQLDTIGRAFLAQTISCARCHDHKFDPIPTSNYYAMAGILKSMKALDHENVSKWVVKDLPLDASEVSHFESLGEQLATLKTSLKIAKKELEKYSTDGAIGLNSLSGFVLDSEEAKFVGDWVKSSFAKVSIAGSYRHDSSAEQGKKSATFEPKDLPPGRYTVRFAYTSGSNRATNALVKVFSAGGEKEFRVNQQINPPSDRLWLTLGEFDFEAGGQCYVLVSNESANGYVIVDAIQFLPEGMAESTTGSVDTSQEATMAKERVHTLEASIKKLESQLKKRPKYIGFHSSEPTNIAIHIRGDVHNVSEIVPRGFLDAVPISESVAIPENASGRLQLANWIAADDNPLTARVYVNRVWSWLMGSGLVDSFDNFGTRGTLPSNPVLLDFLATDFIEHNWSTKHLVRSIVLSDAYQRSSEFEASAKILEIDPANRLYWRGNRKRLPVESIRDAMLLASGELETTIGGNSIPPNQRTDYNFRYAGTRRSIYAPVFRNSLPQLFDEFDFANPSVSIGRRNESTVATQALALLNSDWVIERSRKTASQLFSQRDGSASELVVDLFIRILGREPSDAERSASLAFMDVPKKEQQSRLQLLVQSLFASLDFRYIN
jgi:hypothetical protein